MALMLESRRVERRVNKAELATWFEVSLPTIEAWIRKGMPIAQRGSRGVPWVIDLLEVAEWRFSGRADNDGEIDPERLSPADRKAWYEGEARRRDLQERDRVVLALLGRREDALEVVVAGARSDVEQSVEFDEQSPLVVLDVAVAMPAHRRRRLSSRPWQTVLALDLREVAVLQCRAGALRNVGEHCLSEPSTRVATPDGQRRQQAVSGGVAVLNAALRIHHRDALRQGVERCEAKRGMACHQANTAPQVGGSHHIGHELHGELAFFAAEMRPIHCTHKAYVLLHAPLHTQHQAHGVLHAHRGETLRVEGAARHVAFTELLMVKQHFPTTQPHHGGNALIREGIVLLDKQGKTLSLLRCVQLAEKVKLSLSKCLKMTLLSYKRRLHCFLMSW